MKMALDQFGIGGIGGLFEQAQQPQLQAQQVSSADLLGGNLGGAMMDSGSEMTPDIQTPSTGVTASTVAGQPAISNLDALRKDLLEATESTPFYPGPKPKALPAINNNPLQGLQFFLNMLAMQDTAKESQGKVQGLMSGIQTLIKNEFPNADFEGGTPKPFPMGIF